MEIVVMGCRGFGKVHLRAIKGVDVSIMERDPAVVEQIREQYQIRRVFSSIEEALSSDADAVDIVLPHRLHRPVAEEAMKRGKHVVLEKPIATTLEDAEAIIRTAKETHRKLMVADEWWFDPSVKAAKEVIEQEKIGRPVAVIVRHQEFYDAYGWRRSEEEMGGGALIDGGIHYVDTLLELGGEPETVYGLTAKGGSAIEGEDFSVGAVRFRSGAIGALIHSWSYRDPPLLPEFEVVGTQGSLREDTENKAKLGWIKMNFFDPSRKAVYGGLLVNGKSYPVEMYDVFERMFSGFIKSVEKDEPVPFPPELAKRDLEVVLKIYGKA